MKLQLALLCALAAPLGAQAVHVVDISGGPGSSFTTVNDAISAAADGDVVLVRSGSYAEVATIVGKSLTLQGDPLSGPLPRVDAIVITDLDAGEAVTVRDIHLQIPLLTPANGIELRDNVGPVWIEGLSVPNFFRVEENGVLVENCTSAVFIGCYFGTFFRFETQSPPILFQGSSVHVFDTQFDVPFVNQTDGPPGIRAEGPGVLGVYESTVTGADGVRVDSGHGSCDATDGGAGIHLVGDVELFLQDSIVQGGQGSQDCEPWGVSGPAVLAGTGEVHVLTSAARSHRASSAVRDDGSVDITLDGEPGDRVRVFFSLRRPAPELFLGVLDGPILIQPPLMKVSHGVLPASGPRSLSLPVGDLGPGVEAIVLHMQALFIGAGGELVLSEPTAVTLLDASF